MRKFTTVFALLLLGVFFVYNEMSAQASDEGLIGKEAPGFNLKNIDGEMVSLASYLEADDVEGVIVIFTCNHCPYAKMYEDRIVALDKKYKEMGYPVIAINPNDPTAYPEDDFDNMVDRAAQKGFTFPYLVDGSQEVAHAYQATRTPHNYVLHKEDGQFLIRYVGAIDDSPREASDVEETFLEDAIEALKKGKAPSTAYTKAVGCSIKWKKS